MSDQAIPTSAKAARRRRSEPKPYDFRRQSTLSREHVRTMQIVQETFARGFSTMLASQLRSVTQVTIQSIEQHSYDEYIRDLANPNLLTLLSLEPLVGAAVFQIPIEVAFTAIELMMGGNSNPEHPQRPLTELELQLIRGILDRAMPELRYAFEPVVATHPKIVSQESNPQYAQVAAPTDMVIVVTYEIRIENVAGTATLCIPFSSLQPHLEALSATSLFGNQAAHNQADTRERLHEHLGETPVVVSAQFRQIEMTADEIVHLSIGDIVPLSHPVDEPLTLVVGETPTHKARIGRKNRRLAVLVEGQVDPLETMLPAKPLMLVKAGR
ncbi:MAG: flagellar motor switch protein FliM [Ilumatobacteraceae bacterium]|nr:flagellar motor switch protein FliM [Acidimicrobiales bacterium]MCB9392765.1 flagellar motor switch protein FliM [Acidimicrobiaceae bacterium]